MTTTPPKFQEEYTAKIPALTLLCNLGWQYLPPGEALNLRNGKTNEVVLREVLRDVLRERTYAHAGETHRLSESTIDSLINDLCTPLLNEGLSHANEQLYNHMLLGIAVTEFINGRKVSPTIPIIDWHNVENNRFHFTEEYNVLRTNGVDHRRPDIVCFVNGLPLVVIEAKRPDNKKMNGPTVDEGISQSLRNQRPDEIPQLFAYSQLLLSINGQLGKYGTQGTDQKFWASWREEDLTNSAMSNVKNRQLSSDQKNRIFSERPKADCDWYEQLRAGGELALTGQDKLIASLLGKERLLELMRYFVIFDAKAGKVVARYQQVFAIKRLVTQIDEKQNNARTGGVIWHTTGSGKSFTMVFLSKALILHDALRRCRIVVITDRVQLEDQLSGVFRSSGELSSKKDYTKAMATSGKKLAQQIGSGSERIIFSLIQKFNTATTLPECHNESADIIVLIDEVHRSQGGEANARMHAALPNAAFVGFTGTPLLKDDKTTNKFGPILHAYTMQRAVEDQAVTPLLYEERIPDLDINQRAIDKWFDRITQGLTEQQRIDLKKKFARKGAVYQAEDRIRLIALDIANHFEQHIVEGLKGQIACDSKWSAIKYKEYLDEAGLFESAVVISASDTREGNTSVDENKTPEITKWWKENVGSLDDKTYTQQIVDRFDKDDDLKLIIVVDKLLTGFDEPKNTVLYIDKDLKEHNLIQAIARVNRLHEKKDAGLLIDYRGILAELDTTITKYQDLANRTQGGFDLNDLIGLYGQMSTEYKKLPALYDSLWDIFKQVKNKSDHEQLRQVLVPKLQNIDNEMVDINLPIREEFYERLGDFATCLKIALASSTFYEDQSFSDKDRNHYKETLKQLTSLRLVAKADAGESVEYDTYTEQVKKLMDKHVVGVDIKEPTGVYEVGKMGTQQAPENWNEEKTRNETDIIKTRIAKKIEQSLNDDPYAQSSFSALLQKVIEEAEALFDHPLKQYYLFTEFEEKVDARHLDDIPEAFEGERQAQAFFGVFKQELPETFTAMDEVGQQAWVDLAFNLDQIVTNAVAEHSINPQNIEAEIRKQAMVITFTHCKQVGAGIDHAKRIVEALIQITRVGTSAT